MLICKVVSRLVLSREGAYWHVLPCELASSLIIIAFHLIILFSQGTKSLVYRKNNGWQAVAEPSLTRELDLDVVSATPYRAQYPCHSQAVERHVALTTDVTFRLSGQIGEALVVIAARKLLPVRRLSKKHHEQKLIHFFRDVDNSDVFTLLSSL